MSHQLLHVGRACGRALLRLGALSAFVFGAGAEAALPPDWAVTNLGSFNGMRLTEIHAFNNHGQAAGLAMDEDILGVYPRQGFFYDGSTMSLIAPPSGASSVISVTDMNDAGQVLATASGQSFVHAGGQSISLGLGTGGAWSINNRGDVLLPNGVRTASGATRQFLLPDMYGLRMNESGLVLGTHYDGQQSHMVLDSGSSYRVVGPAVNDPMELNDAGQVASTYNGSAAIFEPDGRITELGRLTGLNSYVRDINDRGQVVGGINFSPVSDRYPEHHAMVYLDGVAHDIHGDLSQQGLGLESSWAYDVNEQGQVLVGTWFQSPGGGLGTGFFLWDNGKVIDLGQLVTTLGDFIRINDLATDPMLNDLGQIALNAVTSAGNIVPLVLTPVPEPEVTVLLAVGLLAGLAWRRLSPRTGRLGLPQPSCPAA